MHSGFLTAIIVSYPSCIKGTFLSILYYTGTCPCGATGMQACFKSPALGREDTAMLRPFPVFPGRGGFFRLLNREISCIMITIQALTKAVPITHLQEPPQERPRFRKRNLLYLRRSGMCGKI